MIVGILAATDDKERFESVINDLQRTASAPVEVQLTGETRLPQVHALNCLKDVFTDTRLAVGSEIHAAESLAIAAQCLDNDV